MSGVQKVINRKNILYQITSGTDVSGGQNVINRKIYLAAKNVSRIPLGERNNIPYPPDKGACLCSQTQTNVYGYSYIDLRTVFIL